MNDNDIGNIIHIAAFILGGIVGVILAIRF